MPRSFLCWIQFRRRLTNGQVPPCPVMRKNCRHTSLTLGCMPLPLHCDIHMTARSAEPLWPPWEVAVRARSGMTHQKKESSSSQWMLTKMRIPMIQSTHQTTTTMVLRCIESRFMMVVLSQSLSRQALMTRLTRRRALSMLPRPAFRTHHLFRSRARRHPRNTKSPDVPSCLRLRVGMRSACSQC